MAHFLKKQSHNLMLKECDGVQSVSQSVSESVTLMYRKRTKNAK